MGMRWCPDLTVAAIVARGDRFLVVEERINGQLVLNQPAGHVEDAESIVSACIRVWRAHRASSPSAAMSWSCRCKA